MPAVNDISDLPRLKYGGEFLPPLRQGLSVSAAYGAKTSTLQGGMPRIRRDTVSNAQLVTVTYELFDPDMVDWFQMFWKVRTLEGSIPFVCMLTLGESEPREYVAVVMDAPVYSEFAGYDGLVTLNLAAEMIVSDYAYWDMVLELQENVPNLGALFNRLEKLVNFDFTESLGAI